MFYSEFKKQKTFAVAFLVLEVAYQVAYLLGNF